MKSFLFLIPVLYFFTGTSFYDLQVSALDGNQVNMFQFNKKKIIIVPFDNHTGSDQLLQLDSLQKTDSSIQIIVTPALDFGCYGSADSLQSYKDSTGLSLLMTQPMYVRKGATQDSVYQWLTQASENKHFDSDIQYAGSLFFISEDGLLYGVAEQSIPIADVAAILYAKPPSY